MRRWIVLSVGLGVLSCGKTTERVEPSGAGGSQASSTGGHSSTSPSGGASSGVATQAGGHTSAGGATAEAGGSLSDTGGASDSSGGAAEVGGGGGLGGAIDNAGGSGGAGVAPGECGGHYVACGCGCCNSEPTNSMCYYPEAGVDLADIQESDRLLATSDECVDADCSSGTQYFCCMPGEIESEATYRFTGFFDNQQHAFINREGPNGHCTDIALITPDTLPNPYPFQPPQLFRFEWATQGPCDGTEEPRTAIGIQGWWNNASAYCVYFDFTLSFLNEDGSVDAVRFESSGVWIGDQGSGACTDVVD